MREVKVKSIRSIERVFTLLDCFTMEERELSLQHIVKKTALDRATLYRMLHTSEKMGYISYNPDNDRYRLTMKLFALGTVAVSSIYFRKELSRFLDKLVTHTPHTILVAAIHNDQLVYLDRRESKQELKVGSDMGQVRPADYGILGKTVLAFLPEQEQQKLLNHLSQIRTLEEMQRLDRFFEQVRQRGFAYAKDETAVGVAGVASPIFNHNGDIIAAIGILAPSIGLSEHEIAHMSSLVREVSQEISVYLGHKKEAKSC